LAETVVAKDQGEIAGLPPGDAFVEIVAVPFGYRRDEAAFNVRRNPPGV